MERDAMVVTLRLLGWELVVDSADDMPGVRHDARCLIYWRNNHREFQPWRQEVRRVTPKLNTVYRKRCTPLGWERLSGREVLIIYETVMAYERSVA